ncbi:hypothetical protein FRB94_013607 [Tulasnella sp. JGI-2019a]|nr:hypothetical protein FRB93_007627 [Tulasnella sp. JGI-2019a]KAG9008247.1 hypothetical protein FRB94_013607 [Tulasnella sp. JGI-2019a]KAG9038036.1 hypothetical protein FRB95_002964 [Tulasnella sp. JGI-2019a]
MSSTTPLLPLSRSAQHSTLTLARTPPPPSRIRIGVGRISPSSPGFGALSRHYSQSPPPSPTLNASANEPTSLSGRLKNLIKLYGWYALGMYIAIGVVDFGVAFACIHFIGAERVSHWTTQAKEFITSMIHPDRNAPEHAEVDMPESHAASKGGREGFIAMILLAYTVHKTLFLPFRVGLTAAFTPKLVNWLTMRGWTGRAGTVRAAHHMRGKVDKMRRKDRLQD